MLVQAKDGSCKGDAPQDDTEWSHDYFSTEAILFSGS